MNLKLRLSFFASILATVVVVTVFCGCGGSSNSANPFTLPTGNTSTTGTISGNITASGTLIASIHAAMGVNGAVKIANADVWLESSPSIKTTTDANGNFSLSGITFGDHRVVAKILTNKGYFKVRSPDITVNSSTPTGQTGSLALLTASKIVRGILRDSAGNPIVNATLSLWGETFTTDANGEFVSPALPDNETTGLIKVVQAANFQSTAIDAPLSSGKTSTAIELTLPKTGETNRAPLVILSASKLEPSPGEAVTLVASATDPDSSDNSSLSVVWEKSDGTLATSANAFQAVWTAPSQAGVATVSVQVTDSQGVSGFGKIAFSIGGGTLPTNNAPTAVILGTSTVFAGNSVLFSVSAVDPDGNLPLTYQWSANGGTFSQPAASFTLWTAPAASGTYGLRCVVSDSKGASTHKLYSVTVRPVTMGSNRAPTGSIAAPAQVAINSTTVVSVTATDLDGDVLSYQWSTNAGGFSTTTAATTTWSAPGGSGNAALYCLISDNRGGQFLASKTVQVATSTVNRPPSVTITGSGSVLISSTTTFFADAFDQDQDPLTYSWSAPTGSFNPRTASVTTYSAPATATTVTISCAVADGKGAVTTGSRVITVYTNATNSAPIVSIIGTSTVLTNASTTLVASATDPNGDVLAFAWTTTLGNLSHSNASTTTLTAPATIGTATLQCVVSDGKGGTTTTNHALTILQGNRAPSATLTVGTTTVPIASTATLLASATDLDGDAITYLWTASGGTLLASTTASSSWQAPTNATGSYSLSCRVSDSKGASSTTSVTVTVPDITLSSSGFANNADLASTPTYLGLASGSNLSPPLAWSYIPANTQSLAITCFDVTASFSHWVVYNIPATYTSLSQGQATTSSLLHGILQGKNDYNTSGYDGPEPPPADPYHYYHFVVVALDNASYTTANATFTTLATQMNGHIISKATLIGKFKR